MVSGSRTSVLFALACLQTTKRGLEQVRAIALCLQLGVGGNALVDAMEKDRGCGIDIVTALNRFEEEGYVTCAQGEELLEVGQPGALKCPRSDLRDKCRTRLITRRRDSPVYTRQGKSGGNYSPRET